MNKTSLTHKKNIIRNTLYWDLRKLRRSILFLKLEIIKSWKESVLGKFLIRMVDNYERS